MDLTALFACVALAGAAYAGPAIYPHYMDPRRHPDETRRAVKPPDRAQFGNRMQFTSIRHLPDNAAWRDALDTYVVSNRLGNLVWPNLKVLGNGNLPEIVAEIKRRGLWLFDVWGYLPNGKAQGVDGLWRMPSGVCEMLERELGDRWLGMDNGEQDGRWSGSPRPAPGRFAHLLRFQRYFEHMDKTLGNKMAALVSLNYGHYFLRANCYTMLGAETAQALPNGQVYYAFIRGAGKQYGVPWFGNVSVFNRWGWKCYPEKETPGADSGPEKGASLALLKKLLYTQLFYNGLACGFEGSFFHGGFAGTGALSPVGEIQQEAVDWIDRHGDPGVMAVPVGLVIDSARGWCFPRHLYSGWSHVCWGAIPFERSDYFTDGVLDLLYPGYQDSGFFRDERGFNAPTPYGDIADCLLSDAPLWVLKQYALLVLAGAIQPTEEFRDALAAYVAGGGRLVLTEGNRRALFPAGLPAAANGGTVTVIASDWGVAEQPRVRQARYPVETPYVSPYPLTDAARRAFDAAFRDAALFTVSPDFRANGLSLVACRRAKGDYTLCIANNTWTEQPLRLTSHVGKILSVEELPTSCRERAARGFAPETATNLVLGADTSRSRSSCCAARRSSGTSTRSWSIGAMSSRAMTRRWRRSATGSACRGLTCSSTLRTRPTSTPGTAGRTTSRRSARGRRRRSRSSSASAQSSACARSSSPATASRTWASGRQRGPRTSATSARSRGRPARRGLSCVCATTSGTWRPFRRTWPPSTSRT